MTCEFEIDYRAFRVIRRERLYESFRAVNNGWRFTARIKSVSSFAAGPRKRFRASKKLQNDLGPVSGYALSAEKICPKENPQSD